MTARFDLEAAEKAVADLDFKLSPDLSLRESEILYRPRYLRAARMLPAALVEIRRLLGVVYEFHKFAPRETSPFGISCACPDCAAWRATTKETT